MAEFVDFICLKRPHQRRRERIITLTKSKDFTAIIVFMVVVGVCGAGWFALPFLQDDARAVDAQASVELERARRLLDRYVAGLTLVSLVSNQYENEGIEVYADDLSDEMADDYQEIHAELWESYQPQDRQGDSLRPARASYGNLTRQIQQGLNDHVKASKANERLLADALKSANKALSISVGDSSSRSHAEAARLKGTIQYQLGIARLLEAKLMRQDALRYRNQLRALKRQADRAIATSQSASDLGYDEHIAASEERITEAEFAPKDTQEKLTQVDARIADLLSRLISVEQRRDRALSELNTLKEHGLDFSDADASRNYKTKFMGLDRAYRMASREARALRFGTYPHAELDYAGDYLYGQYVEEGSSEVTIEFGLQHFLNQQAILKAELSGQKEVLSGSRESMGRLKAMRDSYLSRRSGALEIVKQASTAARETFEDMSRVHAEAEVMEDTALELFAQSSKTLKQASSFSGQWVRKAREKTRGLSPEAKERSGITARERDDWMSGFSLALEADAKLAAAFIYYERYFAYQANAGTLDTVKSALQLGEADPDAERAKASEARKAGSDRIAEAIDSLQQAHRQVGNHWTISAQAAGTTYLLALFGHEDYVKDTIEAYRTAVAGRENDDFAAVFTDRLKRLEAAGGY